MVSDARANEQRKDPEKGGRSGWKAEGTIQVGREGWAPSDRNYMAERRLG